MGSAVMVRICNSSGQYLKFCFAKIAPNLYHILTEYAVNAPSCPHEQ